MCPNDILIHFFGIIYSKMLTRGHHIRSQFLSTIFANLINVTYGLTIAWNIIYATDFHTNDTPLEVPPLSQEEVRWIDLALYVGGLVGTVFLTMTGDIFGKKYTLVVLIVPQGFAWWAKMCATNATEVYIGRFLSGFSAGGSINLVILFVAELADDKFRGRLGTILPLSINIGLLIIFISNIFLSFYEIASVTFVVLFLYLCIFGFFPDTPRQLYKIRRKEQAIESLQVYRDIRDLECQTDDCYQIEVKRMRRSLISERGFAIENSGRALAKSLIISVFLIVLNVSVNWFVIYQLTYRSLLDTSMMTVTSFRIVIAACQISGNVLCLILVDFIERKYLLLASVCGITIAEILYSVFQWNTSLGSLPILFIAVAAFSLHFGVFPLSFVVIPEVIPEKVRIYTVTFVFSLMWVLMFALASTQSAIVEHLQISNSTTLVFLIIFNIISVLVFWIYIPPTKKKSYNQIFTRLNYGARL